MLGTGLGGEGGWRKQPRKERVGVNTMVWQGRVGLEGKRVLLEG